MTKPKPSPRKEKVERRLHGWALVSSGALPALVRKWNDGPNQYAESALVLILDAVHGPVTGHLEGSGNWAASNGDILRNVTHWRQMVALPR